MVDIQSDRRFDAISFLESEGVEFWRSGKNTSRGWVSLRCRLCMDHSNHFGINLETKACSCLKCGAKGGPAYFVKAIKDCDWAEAYQTVQLYQLPFRDGEVQTPRQNRVSLDALPIPKSLTKKFQSIHLKYLAQRRFNPAALIEKYDLYAGAQFGRYRWRIVAPIYMDGIIVNFIGRDITGKAEAKYILQPEEAVVVPRREIIYNLDNLNGNTALIVEGPTDAWRIGDGAIATIGTRFTHMQIQTILKAGIKRAFVMYDPEPEAQALAHRLNAQLSAVLDEAILLEKQTLGDPGDMHIDEVLKLREDIWGSKSVL